MTNKAAMYENPTNDRWQCIGDCNTVLAEFATRTEVVDFLRGTLPLLDHWYCLHVVGPGGRIQLIEF